MTDRLSLWSMEIKADVHAIDDEGGAGPKLGEVVVNEQPDGPRMFILVDQRIVFSAPLAQLAWQLALMEPRLGMFLVDKGDSQ